MLRIDRENKKFTKLQKHGMSEAGITEKNDLQEMIKSAPSEFFQEMGEKLLLIGDEVRPADFVEDRIDLLAIDQQGSLVVIELKRGSHKLHLLQALAYASMVSKWEQDRIIAERQRLAGLSEEEVEEEVEQFLVQDVANLNDSQRIILIAEDFDYEVLVTAEWLSEIYDVDIRCYRLALSVEGKAEFLTCTCIYPPPEITQHARRRGRRGETSKIRWSDWDEALSKINNQTVVEFFRKELETGRENYLRRRALYYRFDGRRMFFVGARKNSVYVWQYRRFLDDKTYWTKKIGTHLDVEPVKNRKALRFHLAKAKDFEHFIDAINGDLQSVKFSDEGLESSDEDEEDS